MDKNTNISGATLGTTFGTSFTGAAMSAPLPTPFAEPMGIDFAAPPTSPDFKPSHCVKAELLLSTPLTVVVRARLEFFGADGEPAEQEVALVIARSRCEGDHPYWPALLSAAQEHWHRCPGHARRLLACVDGDWQTLLAAQIQH